MTPHPLLRGVGSTRTARVPVFAVGDNRPPPASYLEAVAEALLAATDRRMLAAAVELPANTKEER